MTHRPRRPILTAMGYRFNGPTTEKVKKGDPKPFTRFAVNFPWPEVSTNTHVFLKPPPFPYHSNSQQRWFFSRRQGPLSAHFSSILAPMILAQTDPSPFQSQ